MIMGIIILKKRYTLSKFISVGMITIGIILCTLLSSQQKAVCTDCGENNIPDEAVESENFFWWLIGILILVAALLLSARMGIYQEKLYQHHGKHPDEALYYTVCIQLITYHTSHNKKLLV